MEGRREVSGADAAGPSWPSHFNPGALRFSHSSANYDETIAFFRDIVGLPVIGEFTQSFGEDGTIFGLPGSRIHLEVVRGSSSTGAVDPLDRIVFYLSGAAAVRTAVA